MKERKLPEGCKVEKLEDVVKIDGGFAFKSENFTASGTPVIRIGNIVDSNIEIDYETCYDDTDGKYERYYIKNGDILIAMSGATTGKLAKYRNNEKCLLNQRVGRFSVYDEERLDSNYLYYYLRSNFVQNKIEIMASGCAQPNISPSQIMSICIPVPPLENQKKIVEVLEKAERALDKRKEVNELLDELVKSRFIEMFGDTVSNPKGYNIRYLVELADIVSGITKGRKVRDKQLKEVPYMRVANVKDGYIDWSEIKTIEVTEEEIQRYCLLEGDVLMTEGGDPDKLGRGAILYNPPENCIHQNHIFRVRLNKENMNPVFLSEYLKHPLVKRYFLKCAKQTTGIASINMSQLKKMPILLPPIELQNQFAAFVNEVDKLKFKMEKSLKELEDNFNSLMQKAFKGELFN